jgi:DNA-binding transcriptional MocR family regulator
MDDNKPWVIRLFVYRHFAETTRPPSVEEAAAHFEISREEAISAYEELHTRHALYLKPGSHEVLMANPFSGVETPFKVHAHAKTYFANCAWDSLGIPAALHADAKIEAICAQSGVPVHVHVTGNQVQDSEVLVHFLFPFREWYEDLVAT